MRQLSVLKMFLFPREMITSISENQNDTLSKSFESITRNVTIEERIDLRQDMYINE